MVERARVELGLDRSALIGGRGGAPDLVMQAFVNDRIEVVASPLLLAELELVLRRPKLARYVDERRARELGGEPRGTSPNSGMTEREDGSAAARLVAALLECTAPVTQILDHMARSPDATDVDAVVMKLRAVLSSALAPLEERIPGRDLRRAAEIIDLATDAILTEVVLVPHAELLAEDG